jgi:tetratricopeptide (TPR) repeat protein
MDRRAEHRQRPRRWPRGAASIAPAVAAAAALAVLAACVPQAPLFVDYPAVVQYAASADSLGLEAFLALPGSAQQGRRSEARSWRERARVAVTPIAELRALRTIVGLDPTDGEAWLQLARRTRWFGDYQQVEDALDGLRTALPLLEGRRRELAGKAAVCEAWLRYDRGEWRRGLALVDSAAVHGADDDEVQLLRALHLAGVGSNRRAEDIAYRFASRDHRAHWIYGVSFWRRAGPEPAHGIFTGTSSELVSGADDFVKGLMVPESIRVAECYRDFGTVEELLGNWWLAEEKYEASADFVPGADHASVVRIDHRPLAQGERGRQVPVWLAFDRYYVTGSLSAYAALAFERFEAAADATVREFWASAVLDAAGTLVRLEIDVAWARRARGLVLARIPKQHPQARADLEAANRWFEARRRPDLRTLAELGRLYLLSSRPHRARPVLERASEVAPNSAEVWASLGLAYIQLSEIEPALAALRRALELDPELAVAWYNRGLLRYHLEDLPGAVDDLERARELAPQDPDIAGLLEQLQRRLGRPESAPADTANAAPPDTTGASGRPGS